jgi:hypothetical protein
VDAGRLADDEIVYCRIPRSAPWFEEPDQVTSVNFKLDRRRGDLGISVYRAAVVTADEVLAKPDAIPRSLVTQATVGANRALRNGTGEPLNLDVIRVDDEQDPGHAEIRGPVPPKLAPAASKALWYVVSTYLTDARWPQPRRHTFGVRRLIVQSSIEVFWGLSRFAFSRSDRACAATPRRLSSPTPITLGSSVVRWLAGPSRRGWDMKARVSGTAGIDF